MRISENALSLGEKSALQIIRLAAEQAERIRDLERIVLKCADTADRYSYEAAQAIRVFLAPSLETNPPSVSGQEPGEYD